MSVKAIEIEFASIENLEYLKYRLDKFNDDEDKLLGDLDNLGMDERFKSDEIMKKIFELGDDRDMVRNNFKVLAFNLLIAGDATIAEVSEIYNAD